MSARLTLRCLQEFLRRFTGPDIMRKEYVATKFPIPWRGIRECFRLENDGN